MLKLDKVKKGQTIIFSIFVIGICMLWFWWILLEDIVDSENHENRIRNMRPRLAIDNYINYPTEFEAYYNDIFPFRNILISFNSKIDFFIFKKSSNENVILGDDGWLFYSPTLGDYQRNNLYTDEELEEIKQNAVMTKSFFEERGVEFILFIAPNKNSIYAEYMPEYIRVYDGPSRTEQVVNYLRENTDILVIYPKDEMKNVAIEYPQLLLFFKMDTHWNYMGGYFGTQPLLNLLGTGEKVPFENIVWEQVNDPVFLWGEGYDLANMLGLSDVLNEDVNYHLSGYTNNIVTYDGDIRNDVNAFNGAIRTYSDSSDERKVFFARDSFGAAMTPYLAAEFKEVYNVHRRMMTKAQIVEEDPDIFIYEMVERSDYSELNVQTWME